jgi:proteasome lid subunit RPN8/RPN11
MLYLSRDVYDQVRWEGEAAYPEECCGILLGALDGAVDGAAKRVTQAVQAANISQTPRNHYEIAPLDLIHAERTARQSGLEILGFYHSHPDHPADWSATDFAEAHWLGCCYVITSIARGKATVTKAFLLAGATEEDKRFELQTIDLLGAVGGSH